jgi:hypothetical protein
LLEKSTSLRFVIVGGRRFHQLALQQKSQHEYLNTQKFKFSSYPPHQCSEDEHATTKNILEEQKFKQSLFSFVILSKMCLLYLKTLRHTNIHGLKP